MIGWTGVFLSHISVAPKVACHSIIKWRPPWSGNPRRVELSGDTAGGRDTHGSPLICMLIVGLVMVLVGAVIVMALI